MSPEGTVLAEVVADSYVDSVRLLEATRAMRESPGVNWAWAVMGTPANLEVLAAEGLSDEHAAASAAANDLVLAARGEPSQLQAALDAGRETVFTVAGGTRSGGTGAQMAGQSRPLTLDEAIRSTPEANVAIVSVPGDYAALEAHKALSRSLDVLLFSDNVSVEDEVDLKSRARSLGRLVMGPGAGTAALAGVGLGFSNRVAPGPVGVVAAAGTGAQEVMTLLHRWGSGVSHVIGVGGRDMSTAVGGLMAQSGLEALEAHDPTEVTLLVSKPPAPSVAERLLGGHSGKPVVAALIGLDEPVSVAPNVTVCNTLEQGVVETLRLLGADPPDPIGGLDATIAARVTAMSPQQRRLVGLFSGGTLAYEAMIIASRHIGPIYSNTPLRPEWARPAPEGGHLCLDLGEEEFTKGRPHPMIDPEARVEFLREFGTQSDVATVLLDVVIGDGSHNDPAAVLAPVAEQVVASGAVVVAYVLGTGLDPQGLERQRDLMSDAGCVVADTGARAALAAAALVNRDPTLVHHDLSVNLTV